MKMRQSLPVTKFYTFLNQLYDSSLKTYFLYHDVKTTETKTTSKLPTLMITIPLHGLILTTEKQIQNSKKELKTTLQQLWF